VVWVSKLLPKDDEATAAWQRHARQQGPDSSRNIAAIERDPRKSKNTDRQ
jgi:hypothetical protein